MKWVSPSHAFWSLSLCTWMMANEQVKSIFRKFIAHSVSVIGLLRSSVLNSRGEAWTDSASSVVHFGLWRRQILHKHNCLHFSMALSFIDGWESRTHWPFRDVTLGVASSECIAGILLLITLNLWVRVSSIPSFPSSCDFDQWGDHFTLAKHIACVLSCRSLGYAREAMTHLKLPLTKFLLLGLLHSLLILSLRCQLQSIVSTVLQQWWRILVVLPP